MSLQWKRVRKLFSKVLVCTMLFSCAPSNVVTPQVEAAVSVTQEQSGYRLRNEYFNVLIGSYGQIQELYLVGDDYPTNYVMNASNASGQNTSAHEWMGELMFKVKVGNSSTWTDCRTQSSNSGRTISLDGNKVVVTYQNASESKGINKFRLVESYELVDDQLCWSISIKNTNSQNLTIGDLGLPMAFNEIWPGNEEIYETRTVFHSFVGKDSSYIYATRPSGIGKYLLLTPEVSTGAGFEYQDHWRTEERSSSEASWCQDQSGWANGLNVFYIHSDVIKSTNRGYLDNTSLVLSPGEEKTYKFNFNPVDDETDMKTTLYEENILDAVAVPGMTFAKNMPAKMYIHTSIPQSQLSLSVKCPHELDLHEGNSNTVATELSCVKNQGTSVTYAETKTIDGEQYHIYNLQFRDLGQNNVVVNYSYGGESKSTEYQFYIMDSVEDALETHADFMVEKTQWNARGQIYDKVFDDWMMDTKSKRGEFYGYWGWGDDWGLTHGEFIAEKNVYQPVAEQIEAVDEYLDTAIWEGLMGQHHNDYLVHDFLMEENNTTPTYRGYAYPHIYNTYFSMYKIASKYPDMVDYIESADTYLLRAYNILNALYGNGVGYNWSTGLMGEQTTPEIIEALTERGYNTQASNVRSIMATKYNNFKNTKYPYGSEYSYDNTGEEAVYTLAKLNSSSDTSNALRMMSKINLKTRACRGLQPIWYHYGNPTTICGENWWNFQYSASLAGYCMDDYLRLQDNGLTSSELAQSERVNYAGKLANLTCINSGQIDSQAQNIGAVAWTYQSELGNLGGQGTGGGNLHNGWRQMSGEADLGLFGALQILSSDIATDPVFGLFGYGCNVANQGASYAVTPLDGLYTRLNFINEKLYIELQRDQYDFAVVSKAKDSIELNMHNLTATSHTTAIEIQGLSQGTYNVLVNQVKKGSVTVSSGSTVTTFNIPLTGNTYDTVVIEKSTGSSTENNTIVQADSVSVTTLVGTAPVLPTQVKALYYNGDYVLTNVNWNTVNASSYAAAGTFTVTGVFAGSDFTVTATVSVVEASNGNIATDATPSAIINTPSDLGGVAGLNDGYEPTSSTDKSHGVWHNWHGNTSADAWVQYTWDEEVVISATDAYYFTDGNFAPSAVSFQYLNSSGNWVTISDASGCGTALNKYNRTTFSPIITTAFRMIMTPKTLGNGVIEWKVYSSAGDGSSSSGVDRTAMNKAIQHAQAIESSLVTSGYSAMSSALSQAQSVANRSSATQSDVDTATNSLIQAIKNLSLKNNNLAYAAIESTSYVSSWETLSAVNDGKEATTTYDTTVPHYGSWGNTSSYETVTYEWASDVTLKYSDIYFWCDNAGILIPASYSYQYKDANGVWQNVQLVNNSSYAISVSRYNTVQFSPITCSAFRVIINKQANDYNGIGLIEWKVRS